MTSQPYPLAFLALLLAFAASGAAPQRAGRITALRGDVSIIRPGKEARKPELKEDIFEGDTLKTGARGRLQVCFEDDSIVSIGRKAQLVVTKYLYDPSAKKGAMKIQIKEGFFRVLGGAITRISPENFETVAGTASIGVRGCSFGGEVADGTAMIVFFGSDIGGTIDVTADGVRRLLATAGHGLSVRRGDPPSMPSPMGRFSVRVLLSFWDQSDQLAQELAAILNAAAGIDGLTEADLVDIISIACANDEVDLFLLAKAVYPLLDEKHKAEIASAFVAAAPANLKPKLIALFAVLDLPPAPAPTTTVKWTIRTPVSNE